MSVKDYKGMRELVLAEQARQEFEAGFQKIRATILSRGFDQHAVDSLIFKVSEHMLMISEDERRSGAFHIYADGKPFYALKIGAPGSLMDMPSKGATTLPTSMTAQQQAILISFEIGVNLLPKMEQALTQYCGQPERSAGSVSGMGMFCDYETTLRCSPTLYCQTLNELVQLRLDQIVATKAPAPKPPAPRF